MNGMYVLDENGNPVPCEDLFKWGRFMQEYRRIVKRAEIYDVLVSTVFLGLDHGRDGQVLLYETMVFGGPMNGCMERYETREQAEEGHEKIVALVKGLD